MPFRLTTGSIKQKTTLIGATHRGTALASAVPRHLLLPGQETSTGGLSFVVCSKGKDEDLQHYRRPKNCSPVITLSFDVYCGRTDGNTRAFELYQSDREVASHAMASYHGCMHFQQPEPATVLPTDNLITRVAGTVRTAASAAVKLNHGWCTRTIEFTLGIEQGPHQTWLWPLRKANARQTHRVVLNTGWESMTQSHLFRVGKRDTLFITDTSGDTNESHAPTDGSSENTITIEGHEIDIEWHDSEYTNRHNADI